MTGRLEGRPAAASLYASSITPVCVSKWMVPRRCGGGGPPGGLGAHRKLGSALSATLILTEPDATSAREMWSANPAGSASGEWSPSSRRNVVRGGAVETTTEACS